MILRCIKKAKGLISSELNARLMTATQWIASKAVKRPLKDVLLARLSTRRPLALFIKSKASQWCFTKPSPTFIKALFLRRKSMSLKETRKRIEKALPLHCEGWFFDWQNYKLFELCLAIETHFYHWTESRDVVKRQVYEVFKAREADDEICRLIPHRLESHYEGWHIGTVLCQVWSFNAVLPIRTPSINPPTESEEWNIEKNKRVIETDKEAGIRFFSIQRANESGILKVLGISIHDEDNNKLNSFRFSRKQP